MYSAAYLRVSGQKQRTASQRDVIAAHVKQHRIKNVKYMQDKKTGRNMRRPQLQTIIADCRAGKCNRILLYKLDRLARNTRETLNLFQELTDLGVQVICVTQNLTFDNTAMGKFMLSIFAAVAELESDHISERVKAGQAVARENGVTWGGQEPTAQDKRKRLKIQKSVDKIGASATAEKHGVSRQAVYQMLERMSAA